MREGPLSALFRRTGEPAEEEEKRPPEQAEAPPSPPPTREEPVREEPVREEPVREEEEARPDVPTPKERLRQAFSSDLPDNMLRRSDPYTRGPAPSGYEGPRPTTAPVLRVIGVGGAGVNAVNRMVDAQVEGVEFLAINTDLQSLQQSAADVTLHIGAGVTKGLGSGSDAELGRQAAMEEYDKIKALLKG